LATECKDTFRLKIGAHPPANVKPLVIKLRDGAEPVRMSARKYAPPQLKFISDKIRELEELGLVYKNTGAEWASPPLIPPKPGFRPVSHDCLFACTERFDKANYMAYS
jgi:hypothetical protein